MQISQVYASIPCCVCDGQMDGFQLEAVTNSQNVSSRLWGEHLCAFPPRLYQERDGGVTRGLGSGSWTLPCRFGSG